MRPSTATDPSIFRNCWREPYERPDGRPLLLIREFWTAAEQEAYEAAAHEHPRIVDPEADTIESPMAYIARLAGIVAKGPLIRPAKRFPPKHRMNPEYPGPRLTNEGGLAFEEPYEQRLETIFSPERTPGEEG